MIENTCNSLTKLACGVGAGAFITVSIAAGLTKNSIGCAGGLATLAMSVDSYFFNKDGMYYLPKFYTFNDCKKPVPTLVNVVSLFQYHSCQGYAAEKAEQIFQAQTLIAPIALGATLLGYYAFNRIENVTRNAANFLFNKAK